MRTSPQTQKDDRAFTLLELLVVITIIATLAGLLLPVINAVTNNGRRTQAISDERGLMTAVFAYMGDFNNKLPTNGDQQAAATASNSDAVYGGGQHEQYPNCMLMHVLRGVVDGENPNNVLNPNQGMYFNEPYAKSTAEPRNGLVKNAYTHGGYSIQPDCFVDSWGNEYVIYLDACRDGNLNNAMLTIYPAYPKDTDPSQPKYGPFGTVQIGSAGADGIFGKNGNVDGSDDILLVQ